MSSSASLAAELRTTTLIFGPFPKPLSLEHVRLLAQSAAKAIGLGYAVMRVDAADSVKVVAVHSAPRTQPFTRTPDVSRAEA